MNCTPRSSNSTLYMPEQDRLKTCSAAADQKFKARQILGLTRELHLLLYIVLAAECMCAPYCTSSNSAPMKTAIQLPPILLEEFRKDP